MKNNKIENKLGTSSPGKETDGASTPQITPPVPPPNKHSRIGLVERCLSKYLKKMKVYRGLFQIYF